MDQGPSTDIQDCQSCLLFGAWLHATAAFKMSALWVFLLLTTCACSTHGQLPTVHINDCGGIIVAGQNCTLVCSVSGIGSSNPTISYQWIKNNGATQTQVGSNSNTLAFSSLRLSDAGQYTCRVTVGSEMYGYTEYIHIKIPAPLSVTLTSDPLSPVRPVGGNVTMACSVDLSPAIDVPVTVNFQLSDPAGSPLTTTTPSASGSTYIATAMVNSFGREESGNYTCSADIISSSLFFTNSGSKSTTAHVTVGVYLLLKEKVYANNSIFFPSEIGESYNTHNNALQCITGLKPCCSGYYMEYPYYYYYRRLGNWYFPNGTGVHVLNYYYYYFNHGTPDTSLAVLYRNRGSSGNVNLNHIKGSAITFPTGLYCCIVPDANRTNKTLCAVIALVNITQSGVNTAGEKFILECSLSGTNDTDNITFQWSNERNILIASNISNAITISTSGRHLHFIPLQHLHEGMYTCTATVNGATEYVSTNLSVNAPILKAWINDGGARPIIGQDYVLTCGITGAENLSPNITYQWTKDSGQGGNRTQVGTSFNSTSFSPLQLSNAGQYTCRIFVQSPYIYKEMIVTVSQNVILEILAPLQVTVRSNKPNPIRPIGSTVTLTCTVELSPLVDIPVTVNTVWTGPAGFIANNIAQPVMGSPTTYTSTAMVRSFGREQSGVYSCNATAESMSSFISSSNQQTGAIRSTTGVYLSLKGVKYYTNNSIVTNTEIGQTDAYQNNALQCVTDRKPCCDTTPNRFGEWYFPNETIVPIPGYATSYYRLRGDDGTINLNRLTSDVTHPTGQFCCVVPDATDIYQTLCINIIPKVSARIVDDGTPLTVGQKYSLTCSVSGAENIDPTITYRWIKNNGTQTYIGTNSSILLFSSLRLSDAGQYSCEIIVNAHLLQNAINKTSMQFEVHIPVPQPIVRLVSDTPDPIRSGSSPILTCAAELSPAVDVPVAVSTVWTGPDSSILMSAAPPVMKSFTHYTSKVKLNYVESADSGNYTCTVSIEGKTRASVGKLVIIGDGMFQIRLKNADVCQPWYKSTHPDMEAELYKYHIEEALVEAIESRCECHFPKANLLKALFSCASSPNLTTYRNTLIGTHNFNATQLIGFIQDWVTFAPRINIKDYSVWLDSSCPVAIASLMEPECGEVRQCPCAKDPNVVKCMEHLENENFAECINTCI